jgi:hypothetical protein
MNKKTITIIVDPKEMKELESITMRQDLRKIMSYGFTALAIAKYIGNGISDRAIREYVSNKRRNLNSYNHNLVKQWTTQVLVEIDKLEGAELNYVDLYLDAIKDEEEIKNEV